MSIASGCAGADRSGWSSSPGRSRSSAASTCCPTCAACMAPRCNSSSQEAIYGIKAQQQKGEGAEFEALREYVPGLDSRFIDWKHSARHRKLLCKEFRTERNHQVIMAFDTGYLMLEPVEGITRLDHAINAGAGAGLGLAAGRRPRRHLRVRRRGAAISSARSAAIVELSAPHAAPPPSSTISIRRPISRSASPSSTRGSSGARW